MGKEMAKSPAVLFFIEYKNTEIPKQWQLTTIKSVRKKKNWELSDNHRGLFKLNVVSKITERAKKTQNENKITKI